MRKVAAHNIFRQILVFIVALRANKIHSELLLLFCLFRRWLSEPEKWREEQRQRNTLVDVYHIFLAVTSYENVAKVPRKNDSHAEIGRHIGESSSNADNYAQKVCQHFYENRKLFVICREKY